MDMLDLLPANTVQECRDLLGNFNAISTAALVDHCPCGSFCNAMDVCHVPQVDLDTGGLPCVDWSQAGKLQRESGRTGPLFILWSKLHKTRKTKLVILENAKVIWHSLRTF